MLEGLEFLTKRRSTIRPEPPDFDLQSNASSLHSLATLVVAPFFVKLKSRRLLLHSATLATIALKCKRKSPRLAPFAHSFCHPSSPSSVSSESTPNLANR